MKGLLVFVYRNAGLHDCTNNGLTSRHAELLLVHPKRDLGPFEVKEDEDYLVLIKPTPQGWVKAIPASLIGSHKWVMFGGNFVYTSDSRFAALNNGCPIPIHDRVEEYPA